MVIDFITKAIRIFMRTYQYKFSTDFSFFQLLINTILTEVFHGYCILLYTLSLLQDRILGIHAVYYHIYEN